MVPDTFNDLPLHALAVHAAVVLVPLAAFLGVVFAVPRLRRWAMVPLALTAIGAAASTWVATQSGEALMAAGGIGAAGLGGPVAELVEEHAELGDQLFTMVAVYAGVAVVAAAIAVRTERAVAGGPERSGSDDGRRRAKGPSRLLTNVLAVLLVIGAVVVGVQTYRVGDSGAEAVWNPTGEVDYSTE